MSPDTLRDLRLVLAGLAIIAGTALLGTFLHHTRPTMAKWHAAAALEIKVHQARLLEEASQRNDRAWVAYIQRECGAEAWYLPREGALPVCSDKHGRGAGQAFGGAQP